LVIRVTVQNIKKNKVLIMIHISKRMIIITKVEEEAGINHKRIIKISTVISMMFGKNRIITRKQNTQIKEMNWLTKI